jgi:hypothetical protein
MDVSYGQVDNFSRKASPTDLKNRDTSLSSSKLPKYDLKNSKNSESKASRKIKIKVDLLSNDKIIDGDSPPKPVKLKDAVD